MTCHIFCSGLGGWGGIRTHGGFAPTPVFKTVLVSISLKPVSCINLKFPITIRLLYVSEIEFGFFRLSGYSVRVLTKH